ncbi:MAG: 2,3-butanediol dehydrogenase [Rhodospirillales bacterium]
MKALLLEGRDSLVLREVAAPAPGPGEVLLSVEAAGIGGSECQALADPGRRPLPQAMGHGIVGRDPQGRRVAVFPLRGCGDCAFCRADRQQLCDDWSLIGVQSDGGFQQQLAVPEAALEVLPEGMSWQAASFVEPFANAVAAWDRSLASAGDRVAVLGAGGLGLGLVACAAEADCRTVELAEPAPSRRAAAGRLGAMTSASALEGGFDVVFDTVGSEETRATAIDLTVKGGRCLFLGFATPRGEIDFSALIRQQKTLIGSFVYDRPQFRRAIALAARCPDDWVQGLGFDRVEPALRAFREGRFDPVKAALLPNGDPEGHDKG